MSALCLCGCGLPAPVPTHNDKSKGWIKGEPRLYRKGHLGNRSRFTKLDDTRYTVEDRGYKTPCWIWGGSISGRYGQVRIEKRNYQAHRIYYERLIGPIPEGLVLDHLCTQTTCVNPDHLEPVTQQENVRRAQRNQNARL